VGERFPERRPPCSKMQRAMQSATRSQRSADACLSLRHGLLEAATGKTVCSEMRFATGKSGIPAAEHPTRGPAVPGHEARPLSLARQMHLKSQRGIPVPGRHQVLTRRLGSPTSFRACGRLAPDPHSYWQDAPAGSEAPARSFCGSQTFPPVGTLPDSHRSFYWAGSGQRLDSRLGGALVLQFGCCRSGLSFGLQPAG